MNTYIRSIACLLYLFAPASPIERGFSLAGPSGAPACLYNCQLSNVIHGVIRFRNRFVPLYLRNCRKSIYSYDIETIGEYIAATSYNFLVIASLPGWIKVLH